MRANQADFMRPVFVEFATPELKRAAAAMKSAKKNQGWRTYYWQPPQAAPNGMGIIVRGLIIRFRPESSPNAKTLN
jgi:hypothetical protein